MIIILSPLAEEGARSADEGKPNINKNIKLFQKQLRGSQTPAEDQLWYQLRDRRLKGFKFRRQACIGRYIVDFICYDKNLIIEVDGCQHQNQENYDGGRTSYLNKMGYHVIRFWNNEILYEIEEVLAVIYQSLIF